MGNALSSSLIFIVQTLGNFYIFVCLLRVILPLAGVSYINPISQIIVRATEPGVKLFRMVLPSIKGFSLAALTWAYVMQLVLLMLIYSLKGINALAYINSVLIASVFWLLNHTIDIYFFALIIVAIASFVAPFNTHPALQLIRGIVEPLLRPIRKMLPPMGIFDFSVLVCFILLNVVRIFLANLF